MTPLELLEKRLDEAMIADRHRLRRRLRRLGPPAKHRDGGKRPHRAKGPDRRLEQIREQIDRSVARAEQRRGRVPKVTYDGELPVCQRRDELAEAIGCNQVVVVCGETGSGKSTQLPKICLELGRGVKGLIGHTQPRRIAARSVAARIAEELGSSLGQDVGFKIRFADSTSPNTLIKLMTDGILLAETQGDRFLEKYDTIIIDEAHERSLNIDFLLGYVKRLLPKRPDLKLIITSATIDASRFAGHFASQDGPAPVLEVRGRMYPVELRYRPLVEDDVSGGKDLFDAVVETVEELARVDPGDMLIFMPTERDIHETAKLLRSRTLPGDTERKASEILPLYARLPVGQQQKIFQPRGRKRRIVIATNVAESSVTVPGIRYVIDSGTARISRYSARSKTQRLPIESISQASADQRAGRCGRVGPGVCVRLYSEADYQGRVRYTTPEIQRSNLASVILQAKALKLGDIARFPFLDPPKPATIRDGYKTLFELGAIDQTQNVTDLGRQLARLPVDPRIGRMILAADENSCLAEMLIIAAALEIRDPRERPHEKTGSADEAHARFTAEHSDFLTYLKLWDFYHEQKQKLSRNQLRKACKQNFLSYNRMREWSDIHLQLKSLVEQASLKTTRRKDDYDAIHRSILSGVLSNLANRSANVECSAAGGMKFHIWPGSTIFRKKPKWLMAAELVETSRRYLRTCARIDPAWIEPLAEHLVKRTLSEPHWDEKSGSAMAFERVSLFGLVIEPKRLVRLGPIDAKTSRELLIIEGLVGGQIDTKAEFYHLNRQLIEEVERTAKKLRRHDYLRGERDQVVFYDERLPDDVYDVARLEKWYHYASQAEQQRALMTWADLAFDQGEELHRAAFPDAINAGCGELPVQYEFAPGTDRDGVHVVVPLEGLGRVRPDKLGWLVPGLLEQKVTALIKALPKPLRRPLVPAPDTAKKVVAAIGDRFGEGCLLSTVAGVLSHLGQTAVRPDDFDLTKIPDVLRMGIRVVDHQGETMTTGRDCAGIRRELSEHLSEHLAELHDPQWSRDGMTSWEIEELPLEVQITSGGAQITAFPMLVDRGESVALRLADSLDRALEETRRAVMRLGTIALNRDLKSQINWLPQMNDINLQAARIQGFDLGSQLRDLLARRALDNSGAPPRNTDQFEQYVARGGKRIGLATQDVAVLVPKLFMAYRDANDCIEGLTTQQWQYAADDMREQLARLVHARFLTRTPWRWLQHCPRFLQAIVMRIDRLRSGAGPKDRASCEQIQIEWQAYEDHRQRHEEMQIHDPALTEIRWMIEELRVSLFAQKLGTSMRISGKRIAKQWENVRA